MPLARLYDRHAEECARAGEQTDDPRRRALMIKLAAEWRRDAQALRQSGIETEAPVANDESPREPRAIIERQRRQAGRVL